MQSVDDKAEAELAKLAEARLALADKGFVSSDSEGEGQSDNFVGLDDAPLYTGPPRLPARRGALKQKGRR